MVTLTVLTKDPAPPATQTQTAPIPAPIPGTVLISTLQWNNLIDLLEGNSAENFSSKNIVIEENLDFVSAFKIVNLVDPTLAQDAATKKYVDDQILTIDTLAELTDVTITTRAANQALVVNSGNTSWINALIANANLSTGVFANITGLGVLTQALDLGNNSLNNTKLGTTLDTNGQIIDGTYPTAASNVLSTKITAESFNRIIINASGVIEWGGGAGATDVVLSRGAANVLQVGTGDDFELLSGDLRMTAGDILLGANLIKTTFLDISSGSTRVLDVQTTVLNASASIKITPGYTAILNANIRGVLDIYSSTDVTNFERIRINSFGSNGFVIDTQAGGTGAV